MAGLTCMDLWSETQVGPGGTRMPQWGAMGVDGGQERCPPISLLRVPWHIRDPWFLHRLGQDRGWGVSVGTVF